LRRPWLKSLTKRAFQSAGALHYGDANPSADGGGDRLRDDVRGIGHQTMLLQSYSLATIPRLQKSVKAGSRNLSSYNSSPLPDGCNRLEVLEVISKMDF
jgi:hypothetical protein